MQISLNDLMAYTDWERRKWRQWLPQHGNQVLDLGAGPHGDGRFESVGDLVRHIFAAEKRYVERLSGRPLTDQKVVGNGDIDELFEFGEKSRQEFEDFLATLPEDEWDTPKEFKVLNFNVAVTPRKVATHVLLHEIRHWAQIATLLRLNGLVDEFHDLIASPVMGGHWEREP